MKAAARTTGRAPALRDSLEQVWLAGLGALTLTEAEGTKFFKTLVERGAGLEHQTLERLDDVVADAKATVRTTPAKTVARIETGAEEAMTSALHRLGVPTRSDINNLTRRVEQLAETLERRATPPRRTARPRKTPTA